MSLGDYLSKEEKKSLLLPEGIIVGTVLRAFVPSTHPPKEKRFVVVGFKDDEIHLAAVLINSKINFKVNFNDELIAHQIPLNLQGREYLTHDSYVDCSEIFSINIQAVNEKIEDGPESVIKGHMSKNDLHRVINTLVNSDLIKGKLKKKFGLFDYPLDE